MTYIEVLKESDFLMCHDIIRKIYYIFSINDYLDFSDIIYNGGDFMREKRLQLKKKITERPLKIIGAHNALTGILAEKNGFDAIWASGLEISTSLGYPDASIASMNEFLAKAIEINRATNLPVIADCDSGFGGIGNLKRTVHEYEENGISGICLEDKKFPKDNSFWDAKHDLYDVEDFVYMLNKTMEWRKDKDFLIIARTEALISNCSIEESLYRAEEYVKTGADILLIHSKSNNPSEVLDFIDLLNNRINEFPTIAIIPTTYPSIEMKEINKREIKMIIYANQGIRAMTYKLNEVYTDIIKNNGTLNVEDKIATIDDIFNITNYGELKNIENEYNMIKQRGI